MPDPILWKLVNQGILTSTRGVNGGYTLAKPAGKITLLEIVEAIDGPVGQTELVDMPLMPAKVETLRVRSQRFKRMRGSGWRRLRWRNYGLRRRHEATVFTYY